MAVKMSNKENNRFKNLNSIFLGIKENMFEYVLFLIIIEKNNPHNIFKVYFKVQFDYFFL